MALIDDPLVASVLRSNIEGTLVFFQHGLNMMAEGRVTPEKTAEVVLREIRFEDDTDAMSEAYDNAELVINRTPIELVVLDTPPYSFFSVVIYRLRDEPATTGYAVYSDETPLCETMDAQGLIEFIVAGNESPDEKIAAFAQKAPFLVNKIVEIAGFLPE